MAEMMKQWEIGSGIRYEGPCQRDRARVRLVCDDAYRTLQGPGESTCGPVLPKPEGCGRMQAEHQEAVHGLMPSCALMRTVPLS